MNVLAIGAHFDDVELGCGGSLARHIAEGDKVTIYVATDSGYGTYNGKSIRDSKTAYAEGQRAAALLGTELICGSQKTFELEFGEETNVALVKIIEEKKINCIYTHWGGDVHHDHFNLAKASLHVSRHVPRVLMYRSNWYTSDEVFREEFFVDITNTWEIKKQMILCHESEHNRVGDKWVEYFENDARNNGLKIGVGMEEVFQIVKWLV